MECAVTNALNRHQEKLRKQEESLEMFLGSIDDELVEIDRQITALYKKANDYQGYDFKENLKEVLGDLI